MTQFKRFIINFTVDTDIQDFDELQSEVYNALGYLKNKKAIFDHSGLEIRYVKRAGEE